MAKKSGIGEMRGKDSRELLYDLQEARKGLFDARFQMANETSKSSNIRDLRRSIARIMTVLRERRGIES